MEKYGHGPSDFKWYHTIIFTILMAIGWVWKQIKKPFTKSEKG